MSARMLMLSLAAAALLAGPASGLALAEGENGDKDKLAEGDWEGKSEMKGRSAAGSTLNWAPDEGPIPEEEPTGTPTEPTGEPAPGGDPTPYPDGGKAKPPVQPPYSSVPCPSSWSLEVEAPLPKLVDKQTMLTITLLRTDAYAFLCNLYARAESTWYVDWFATTKANESGEKEYAVTLKIVGACSICNPHINVSGTSILETKAQLTALWGGTDSDTQAHAVARTMWAAAVDCADDCNVTAKYASASSKYGAEFAGAEVSNTQTKGYVYAIALGGKGAVKEVKGTETRVSIVNAGHVAVYAGGANDNAQAKSRVGYWLHLKGVSNCGSWGEFEIELSN